MIEVCRVSDRGYMRGRLFEFEWCSSYKETRDDAGVLQLFCAGRIFSSILWMCLNSLGKTIFYQRLVQKCPVSQHVNEDLQPGREGLFPSEPGFERWKTAFTGAIQTQETSFRNSFSLNQVLRGPFFQWMHPEHSDPLCASSNIHRSWSLGSSSSGLPLISLPVAGNKEIGRPFSLMFMTH